MDHAFIFVGDAATGKTTLSKLINKPSTLVIDDYHLEKHCSYDAYTMRMKWDVYYKELEEKRNKIRKAKNLVVIMNQPEHVGKVAMIIKQAFCDKVTVCRFEGVL